MTIRRVAAASTRWVGRRGVGLGLLGTVDLFYGAALLLTKPVTMAYQATWWPASVGTLGGIPVHDWGYLWIGVGLFVFIAVPRPWRTGHEGRWQFAAEALLKSWWALASVLHWWHWRAPGAWAPAATYIGVAALVLLISGWRDPEDEP
jgi:hypothetical protein